MKYECGRKSAEIWMGMKAMIFDVDDKKKKCVNDFSHKWLKAICGTQRRRKKYIIIMCKWMIRECIKRLTQSASVA